MNTIAVSLVGRWPNMTIWNIQRVYYGNKPKYIILPYSLLGTIKAYLSCGKIKDLIRFLKESRLSGKTAQRIVNRLNKNYGGYYYDK